MRLLLILICLVAAIPAAASTGTQRPNIIVIFTDDLGYGDLGSYGAELIATPALDRMAAEGVRLTSFYAAANVCTPSRASLLTGRYAIRSGLAEQVIQPWSTHGLPGDEITIAEMLGANGYRTALIGKWHLGHQPEHHPLRHGFDTFFGIPYSNDMNPLALYEGETAVEQPVEQATMTQRFTDRAIAIVEAEDDRPFFIYLAHPMPHIPLYATEQFRGRSQAGLYGDVVEELDWHTGRLLEALRRSGQADNTLVIFTSDNGPWFEGSTGVHRGRKGTSWDAGYRVPFIAWWPGQLPAGAVSDAPAMMIDLLPTFAGLTGSAMPEDRPIDGRDIWPVLTDGADSPHEALYFFNNAYLTAVRAGNWRLVVQDYYRTFDLPFDQFGWFLLFDLSRDPAERYSLADSFPDILADMQARLMAARERFDVPERPPFRLPVPDPQDADSEPDS